MQTFQAYRTRFGPDIVAEFMPSEKPSHKVVLIASGAPGYPGGKEDLMELLAKKGYWSIVPRYRGTWESNGVFLEEPPSDDLITVMDQIPGGFRDLWGGGDFRISNPEFYLIGGSTGGAAALIASRDTRVKRAALISCVVDWRGQATTMEPLDLMNEYVPNAFGTAYRTAPDAWSRLARGEFFNPIDHEAEYTPDKLLFLHSKDDLVVHAWHAEDLAARIGARFVMLDGYGHMGARSAMKPELWKHIAHHFSF